MFGRDKKGTGTSRQIIVVTTPEISGREVEKVLGLVVGRFSLSGFSDRKLTEKANEVFANAAVEIYGRDVDAVVGASIEVMPAENRYFGLVSGTAVKLKPER